MLSKDQTKGSCQIWFTWHRETFFLCFLVISGLWLRKFFLGTVSQKMTNYLIMSQCLCWRNMSCQSVHQHDERRAACDSLPDLPRAWLSAFGSCIAFREPASARPTAGGRLSRWKWGITWWFILAGGWRNGFSKIRYAWVCESLWTYGELEKVRGYFWLLAEGTIRLLSEAAQHHKISRATVSVNAKTYHTFHRNFYKFEYYVSLWYKTKYPRGEPGSLIC